VTGRAETRAKSDVEGLFDALGYNLGCILRLERTHAGALDTRFKREFFAAAGGLEGDLEVGAPRPAFARATLWPL
jgi:hypothetical protein